MTNQRKPNPAMDRQTDVSKKQSAQDPARKTGEKSETRLDERADAEGTGRSKQEDKAKGGFVGSRSGADRSSELVEDEDFASRGQGAPDRK